MNGREAIQAMLDGKTVVSYFGDLWRLGTKGFERAGSDLRFIPDGFTGNSTYELYQEPNPHPQGSYAWAKEEHKRGYDVTCDYLQGRMRDMCAAKITWNQFLFTDCQFETMTWRRA